MIKKSVCQAVLLVCLIATSSYTSLENLPLARNPARAFVKTALAGYNLIQLAVSTRTLTQLYHLPLDKSSHGPRR
jgi:hypothetical protein